MQEGAAPAPRGRAPARETAGGKAQGPDQGQAERRLPLPAGTQVRPASGGETSPGSSGRSCGSGRKHLPPALPRDAGDLRHQRVWQSLTWPSLTLSVSHSNYQEPWDLGSCPIKRVQKVYLKQLQGVKEFVLFFAALKRRSMPQEGSEPVRGRPRALSPSSPVASSTFRGSLGASFLARVTRMLRQRDERSEPCRERWCDPLLFASVSAHGQHTGRREAPRGLHATPTATLVLSPGVRMGGREVLTHSPLTTPEVCNYKLHASGSL